MGRRRESNPRLLLGRQRHCHYATPAWSGRRESNPRSSLGTAPGYHYITTGKWWAVGDSNTRRSVCRTDALAAELTARIGPARVNRTRCLRLIGAVLRHQAASGMIGTRCGSRTRLYCVKNSGPTDRRTGLALPTRIELVLADRQSAVQTTTLREHGGRCRYRSHAGLSRVLGSFQDCLPGHGRHLPNQSPWSDSNQLFPLYESGARPNEPHGHGVHGPIRTGE